MKALTGHSVLPYLRDWDLLDETGLAQSQYMVADNPHGSTRNTHLIVTRAQETGFFVKQARLIPLGEEIDELTDTLQLEGVFYQRARELPDLAAHLPRPYPIPRNNSDPYIATDHVLLTEYIPDSTPLMEYLRQLPHFVTTSPPPRLALARRLGEVLALFHQRLEANGGPMRTNEWPVFRPPLLDIDERHLNVLKQSDNRLLSFLGNRLEQSNSLASLHQLRELWTPSQLIHTDARLANFLVQQKPGTEPPEITLYLTDWEYAAQGDPVFDVASLIASYLRLSLGMSGFFSQQEIHESIFQLGRGYLLTHPADPLKSKWLLLVIQHAGVQLIQQFYSLASRVPDEPFRNEAEVSLELLTLGIEYLNRPIDILAKIIP